MLVWGIFYEVVLLSVGVVEAGRGLRWEAGRMLRRRGEERPLVWVSAEGVDEVDHSSNY